MADFQRARSDEAKGQRERAILDAAGALGARDGVRRVTLTDIAAEVGMHKSALLRYFETREEIYLRLTAAAWQEWSAALRTGLGACASGDAAAVARVFARTLGERGLFCDLLAQAPLNLERNVSIESVRAFKLVTHAEVDAIVGRVRTVLAPLTEEDGIDLVAAAVSLAGAMWQTATPSEELGRIYREDPRLRHAVVPFRERLERTLAALLRGMVTAPR